MSASTPPVRSTSGTQTTGSGGEGASNSTEQPLVSTGKMRADRSAHYSTAWGRAPQMFSRRPTSQEETERSSYQEVMGKFDEFFGIRRNIILERAKFNSRNQGAGESAEIYITALYSLVETCGYKPDAVNEMLRDCLVVGMRDKALSEQLQVDPDLTVEQVKKRMRQKEAVKEQNQRLQGRDGSDPGPVDAVQTTAEERASIEETIRTVAVVDAMHAAAERPSQREARLLQPPRRGANGRCTRCPAANAICRRCNRKGHYQALCFSKTVAPAHEVTLDTAYLGAVEDGEDPRQWGTTLLVGDKPVMFKLDTGAQVTAIFEQVYKQLQPGALKRPSKTLFGPTHQGLDTLGQFSAWIYRGTKRIKQIIFVVRGLQQNLLGLPAIAALKLVLRIEALTGNDTLMRCYPRVFSGLGKLGEEYHIRLKEGAHPHSEFTARNVAIPLKKKVRVELERMEKPGVISRVTEHTPWCSGMVVVPKKSGEVQICMDLKELNENVLREVYPFPKSTRHSHSYREQPSSASWMPTVDSGRFHWLLNRGYSPPSSHHLGDTVLTNSPSVCPAPRNCFSGE